MQVYSSFGTNERTFPSRFILQKRRPRRKGEKLVRRRLSHRHLIERRNLGRRTMAPLFVRKYKRRDCEILYNTLERASYCKIYSRLGSRISTPLSASRFASRAFKYETRTSGEANSKSEFTNLVSSISVKFLASLVSSRSKASVFLQSRSRGSFEI